MNAAMQLRDVCRKVVVCQYCFLSDMEPVPALVEMKDRSAMLGVRVPQGSFVRADGNVLIVGCHFTGSSF